MKKKIIPFIAAIALIIVVVLFMVLGNIIEKYTPSKETKDLSEYYGLTSDTDVALFQEIGYSEQILDVRSLRVKNLLGLISPGDLPSNERNTGKDTDGGR